MAKKQKIERRAFSQLRVAEYLRFETLQKMTGRSFRDFPRVVVKELLDNALDAVETAGSAPQIEVVIDQDARARCFRLRVVDNGDGLSPDMVARTLDFETLTSDKALYRTPSRGQQGNALKSIIAMPYALGNKNPLVTITARGLQHQIRLRLGAGDEIIPGHKTESVENAEGTDITVWLPKVRVASSKESAFTGFGIHRDVGRLLRGYHLFNPHAKVSFSTSGLVPNMVNPTSPSLPKSQKLTFRPTRATRSSCRVTRPSSTGSTALPSLGSFATTSLTAMTCTWASSSLSSGASPRSQGERRAGAGAQCAQTLRPLRRGHQQPVRRDVLAGQEAFPQRARLTNR